MVSVIFNTITLRKHFFVTMLECVMTVSIDVLCAGVIVADHVSSPISHLPARASWCWPINCC